MYSMYRTYINEILCPKITEPTKVIDLFAGCGGLSLGFEAAGYETIGYEIEEAAVAAGMRTLNQSCLQHIIDGKTTVDEFVRVLGFANE